MPQANIPPNPLGEQTCKDCRFWHPLLADNYAIDPMSGNALKATDAMKNGVLKSRILIRASMCFFNPVWTLQSQDMYCGNFDPSRTIPSDDTP